MVKASGRIGLVAMLVVGMRREAKNRNSGQSAAALVLSSLAIAALFYPLRRVVQAGVGKRFFRRKHNPEQTLAFIARISRNVLDMERLSTALMSAVEESLQPQTTGLWPKPPPGNHPEPEEGY